MSAVADQKTNLGAVAFAGYWVQATSWSYLHVDPSLLEPLASTRCTFCQQTVTYFHDLRAAHHYFVGGQVSLIEADLVAGNHQYGAQTTVDVTVTQKPFTLYGASKTVLERLRRTLRVEFRLWLIYERGKWLIVQRGRAT